MSPDVAPPRGIVSQASVSMKLLRAQPIETGSEIWAEDESDGGEEVWMLAQVLRQDNTLLTVRKKNTGEELEIDLVSVCGVTARVFGLGADDAFGAAACAVLGCAVALFACVTFAQQFKISCFRGYSSSSRRRNDRRCTYTSAACSLAKCDIGKEVGRAAVSPPVVGGRNCTSNERAMYAEVERFIRATRVGSTLSIFSSRSLWERPNGKIRAGAGVPGPRRRSPRPKTGTGFMFSRQQICDTFANAE